MPERRRAPHSRTRTFVVTGSSSGIGQAIALRLLADGHRVIGLARDHSKFPANRSGYRPIALDLGDLDALTPALDDLLRRQPAIDGLVCSAGQGRFGELEQFSPAQIRAAIDLNLTSHLLVARALVPGLKRHGGDIVFIGSESALRGGRRGTVYSAAKFGLRGLAQALREECARSGVRVTIVHPGMVRTPFFDDLDFGPGPDAANALQPQQVAELVATVVALPPNANVDEISISPLKHVVRFKN